MGYFNRHFNKQLKRKGYALVQFKTLEVTEDKLGNEIKNVVTIKGVVKISNIKPWMKRSDTVHPATYQKALSGRM
jgi:hypothetical protein